MIDKDKARQNGVNVIDTEEVAEQERAEMLAELSRLAPSAIGDDGELNEEKLDEYVKGKLAEIQSQIPTEAQRQIDRLLHIRRLFPRFFNADNQINLSAIRDFLNLKNTTSNNKGYELTFAGKGIANSKAETPTKKELKAEIGQSKNFDNTGNVVIRGDNLDALKILRQNYAGKVKAIYIDPPYNIGGDGFLYDDDFKKNERQLIEELGLGEKTIDFLHNVYGTKSHSGWLAFMYPRIQLARDLLTEDGAIFISIDDKERANLKILCDQIFGEDNFAYSLSVVNSLNGNDNSSGMMETQESCLIYTKNKELFEFGTLKLDDEEEILEWSEDELGFWKEGRQLKSTGINAPRRKRPHLFFPIYIDEENLSFSLAKDEKHSLEILPLRNGEEMSWSWSKKKFAQEKHEVIVKKTREGYSLHKKQRPSLGDLPSKRGKTTFYKPSYSNSLRVKALFGFKAFNYPKSIYLIRDFLQLANAKGEDIILDFFAGSGTTGDVVMQLNAEDGDKRKFILVQLDEEIAQEKSAESYKFCVDNDFAPVISSITIERLRLAGEEMEKLQESAEQGILCKEEFSSSQLPDLGYKVFSLVNKPQVASEGGMFKVSGERASSMDKLVNMLCATCKPLDTKIKTLVEGKVYKAAGQLYIIGDVSPKELEAHKDIKINIDGWCNMDLQNWLNAQIADKDNITIIY